MGHALREALVRTAAEAIVAAAEELTALDRAIGDGDHGLNMKRGFEAVLADLPTVVDKPLPEMLRAIGMALVMKVGGASGPLYGTLFMDLGKALPEAPSRAEAVAAFGTAVAAVAARGKSQEGQKTMLDVLMPVHRALDAGADAAGVRLAAADAAAGTVPMVATRGRASFLGERSAGHMDPGARSAQILLTAVAGVLGSRT